MTLHNNFWWPSLILDGKRLLLVANNIWAPSPLSLKISVEEFWQSFSSYLPQACQVSGWTFLLCILNGNVFSCFCTGQDTPNALQAFCTAFKIKRNTWLGISRLNSIVQALCAFIRGLNLFFMTEIQCCISSNRISRAGILEQRASWIDPVSNRCFSTSICSEFFTSSSKANLFWKFSSLNVVQIAQIILSKSSAILKCSLVDNRRTQRVFVGSKMRISRAKWPSMKLHLRGRGRSAETQEQRRLLRSLYQGRLQAEYSGMKVVSWPLLQT